MSFLSAVFIWALPLAAAPIVIHLLHRRQQKVIRWGAMQFLVDSTRRRRRIWRLDDWLLMLLRCAALLALVLALARPLVRGAWVGAAAQRDVILVLDVSMSMGRTTGGETPFDRLQAHVEDVFAGLSEQDSLQVVLAAASPQWQTAAPVRGDAGALAALQAQLRETQPSLGPANLLAAVEQALGAEADPEAQSRLVSVITDARAHGLPEDGEIAAARLQQQLRAAPVPTAINIVDVGDPAEEVRNVALDRVESDRVLAGIGESVVLTAHVTNHGAAQSGPLELRWRVGDETLGVSFVEPLEPRQSAAATIEHIFDAPGLNVVTCAVEARDELPADDEARLILEVRDKVPVLIVASTDAVESAGDEARYALAALGKQSDGDVAEESFFVPTLIDVGAVEQAEFSTYFGIVFTDTPALSEGTVRRLREFVSAGGGLWLALGADSDATEFNRLLSAEHVLSPVILADVVGNAELDDEATALHPPGDGHPATALLGDTARLDIQEARILRRWQLRPGRPDAKLSILLETSRGEPVAVEHFVGRGRVIVQSFPLTRAWSNLTLCKLFVPYVQEWLRYLVQPSTATHNLVIDAPLVWRCTGEGESGDVILHAPLQDAVTLAPEIEQARIVYRYFGTIFPGDYRIELKDDPSPVPFYVQRDPEESDLRAMSPEVRTALNGVSELQFASAALSWPAGVATAPVSAPAWHWLLCGLAGLIGVELASICWFAWRKRAIGRLPAAA